MRLLNKTPKNNTNNLQLKTYNNYQLFHEKHKLQLLD